MFRPMRRIKQQLPAEECVRILETERRGVLAVLGDEGYPYAVPLNFYYDPDSRQIYFHCAKEGHKLDAIARCEKVCFTVHDEGYLLDGDWGYHVKSVIAMGRAHVVEDERERYEKTRRFALKYFPTEEEADQDMQRSLPRMILVAIEIDHMTGKLVHEK
ncbi:MAG: pyridoxamine 5'-phosphate oxidase family protein [Clostridia bacterium]|nr:pyridoxamine 5'-phosphate oxidase family protein [Clostridia bacterium]